MTNRGMTFHGKRDLPENRVLSFVMYEEKQKPHGLQVPNPARKETLTVPREERLKVDNSRIVVIHMFSDRSRRPAYRRLALSPRRTDH